MELRPVRPGGPVERIDQEIGRGRAGLERGLRQLLRRQRDELLRALRDPVHHEMPAARIGRVVPHRIGQGVVVGVGRGEQAGCRNALVVCRRDVCRRHHGRMVGPNVGVEFRPTRPRGPVERVDEEIVRGRTGLERGLRQLLCSQRDELLCALHDSVHDEVPAGRIGRVVPDRVGQRVVVGVARGE